MQLNFEVSRDVRKDAQKALAAVAAVLDLFDDAGAAKRAGWNRREVEPYPNDWQKTKVEYEAWKLTQVNAAVRAKTERVLDEAKRVLAYMPGDDDYLLSFAAGARARSDSWSSCAGDARRHLLQHRLRRQEQPRLGRRPTRRLGQPPGPRPAGLLSRGEALDCGTASSFGKRSHRHQSSEALHDRWESSSTVAAGLPVRGCR